MTYDCFMLFNELDLLEIRLNMLADHVDFFVIGESKQTFSGHEKPLYYLENEARFAKWKHKIIHLEVLPTHTENAFLRAFYQKEALHENLYHVAKPDDVIYFGDIDEIWTPQKVEDDRVYNLQQLNYCYFLNNRSSERWVGTIVGRWKTIQTNTFTYWRAKHENERPNGGWHFTNMGGADQIRKKLEAYDHQEFNDPLIKDAIEEKIASGQDYVGRGRDWEGKLFDFWVDESELPSYIIANKLRYATYFK